MRRKFFGEAIKFLEEIYNFRLKESLNYIKDASTYEYNPLTDEPNNIVNFNDFDVEIGTIHSTKGQTHTCTLYMETFVNKPKSHKNSEQFLGNRLSRNCGVRKSESAKMCYVGMSRPTDLLCIAIEKKNFLEHLGEIDKDAFEIITIP